MRDQQITLEGGAGGRLPWERELMESVAKKRVFLGTVAVVPRADLKRYLERPLDGEATDLALQSHLEDVLRLPSPPPANEVEKHDYAIDIFVARHQSGESGHLQFGGYGIPLLWRPAVEIRSRLYALRSKKTVATLRVNRSMRWSEYLNRSFSLRGYFRWSSPISHSDMTRLLDEALIEMLERAKARL